MTDGKHSTGRGGAGNIGVDDTVYIDGEIVREGVAGESDRPEYSTGRGGAGNMLGTPRSGTPVNAGGSRGSTPGVGAASEDVVPETATREGHENFHTGRGGEGNIHRERFGGHSHAQKEKEDGKKGGLLEKAKHAVGLDKK